MEKAVILPEKQTNYLKPKKKIKINERCY